jgi:hypothetical protein
MYSGKKVAKSLHRRQLHFLLQLHHTLPEHIVGIHQIFDSLTGMYYRSMIPSSEMLTNGLQRILGEYLGQVHRYLTGLHNLTLPGLLQQPVIRQIKEITYHLLYRIYRNLL